MVTKTSNISLGGTDREKPETLANAIYPQDGALTLATRPIRMVVACRVGSPFFPNGRALGPPKTSLE